MSLSKTDSPAILLKAQIRDVRFGKNVKVIHPVNMFECEIGDNCLIAAFVEIQKNTTIGSGTRIQSHSFICENVVIGRNCFIGHGVMFADDMLRSGRPAFNDRDTWKEITIGNNVCLGTHSTIMASICDDVVIGAGAVVTKDITKPGIYAGVPARFLRSLKRETSSQTLSALEE